MAGTTSDVRIRMDTHLKKQAEALFTELGMSLSTACIIFLRQALREGGIPFTISTGKLDESDIIDYSIK